MENQTKKYVPGGIREMMSIAFPMVMANACETVLIFTDRLFLAKLGPVQMNAAMAGGLSVFMMMTFILGLTGYITALAAQYFGAGEKEKCPVATTQGFILAVISFPIILFLRPLAHSFFRFTGVAEDQLVFQIPYFDILTYIILFSVLKHCLSSFFSAIGRTKIVMVAAFFTMICNVLFNYVLVFGKWGFPELGIQGAAYGSIAASFFGLIILIFAYFKPKLRSEFNLSNSFYFDRTIMTKLLKFGYPAGVEFFLNILGFTAMVLIFHAVSVEVATASSVMFNWDLVSYVPLMGAEIGVTSLVGRYVGAKNVETAHRATISGVRFGLCYSAIVFILFIFFPEFLVKIFEPFEKNIIFDRAVPIAVFMVRTASLYVLVQAVIVAYIGALRGAGDTFWAMVLSVAMHWALVPVLYVMLNILNYSVHAAWLTLIAVFYLFSLLILRRYYSGKWKQIHVID